MSVIMEGPADRCRAEQDKQMHNMADLSREKLNQHRIQFMVLLWSLSCVSAILEEILLYTKDAVVPMPPEVEKRRVENIRAQFP